MNRSSRRRFLKAAGLASVGTLGAPSAPALAAPLADPRRYRLGLVTYNIAATWDLATLLAVCKEVGLSPVEFRTGHKHGVEPALSKEQRRQVRARCADAGIEIWGCGTTCEFHAPDPAVVQKNVDTCKAFIQLVADLGGQGVKVRPNGLPGTVPVEKTLEQIGQALRQCGQAAGNAGIEIWLEVHGPGTARPDAIKKIMEHCGHPRVGLTWNSNPTDIQGGSITESFEMLRPWIRSCHINELYKDSTRAYPYRELFRLLREIHYDRVTLVELSRTMADPSAGAELLRYYKALWTELTH